MSLKRTLSTTERLVSPPPTRRKLIKELQSREDASGARPVAPSNLDLVVIYSWNVNGVGPLLQKQISFDPNTSLFPLRTFLKRHQWPHFLCLQEVKIKRDDLGTQRKLEHAANAGLEEGEPKYDAHLSLPRDKYNAIGFGGKVHGVATLLRRDFTASVKTIRRPDWDLEGRVLITELGQNIAIVNGYWPNGTTSPYRDSETGIINGTRHDHKLRFHKHMLDESLVLEQRGFHVVLVGDMNVARSRIDGHPNLRTSPEQHVKNRHDFNQKFFDGQDGFRGIDVFRALHGQTRRYTYHSPRHAWGRSCDRVDLIIASRSLWERKGAVAASDICDNPEDRGHSDHVPLWLGLDWTKLCSDNSATGISVPQNGTRAA